MVGVWQWPMRGWRIGEASHPGPHRMSEAEEEWAFGDGPTPPEVNLDMQGIQATIDDLFGEEVQDVAVEEPLAIVPPPPVPDL